jgi:hypothetical protein
MDSPNFAGAAGKQSSLVFKFGRWIGPINHQIGMLGTSCSRRTFYAAKSTSDFHFPNQAPHSQATTAHISIWQMANGKWQI